MDESDIFSPQLPHNLVHHECVPFENVEYWECTICSNKYSDEAATQKITDTTYYDVHELLNTNVKDYLSATTEAAQINALKTRNPYNDQKRKTINWTKTGPTPYRIEVSTTDTFTESKTYSSNSESFTLPGTLIPGQKYYYRVFDKNDSVIVKIAGFEVDDTYSLRTLAVEGLFNVRDAGGWTAKDGHKVLYNKIIRGGRLTYITDAGKQTLLDELKIKTEIDLRAGDGGSQELVDERLNYRQIGLNQYTMLVPDYISPEIQGRPGTKYGFDPTTPASMKAIFETLADANNYPIYYHCNAGADRTGSITFFINGLLGVSYEDLTRDFELTTFSSQGNRYRSGVEDGHFVTTGELAGIYECDTDNYVAWGKLYELISTNYACENGQLCSAIERYLKEVCNVSDETIQAVRRNLLGEDVEFDPVIPEEKEVDTTFTPNNGNWTIDSQLAYEQGTFFEKECYKFYTTAFSADHYIQNNLSLILDEQYTKFHFEVYVPHTSARWNTNKGEDTGPRFHISVKPVSGSTTQIAFSEDITHDTPNSQYHLDLDTWVTYEISISSYTELKRFAFYLPYGTSETPAVVYLRNVYVD